MLMIINYDFIYLIYTHEKFFSSDGKRPQKLHLDPSIIQTKSAYLLFMYYAALIYL